MPSCPISNERVDERVARIVGWLVFFVALLDLFVPHPIWLAILLEDFTARSFYRPASLFAQIAKRIVEKFGKPQIVDAAPKIFAARIGLGMTLAAIAAYMAQQPELSRAILAVMALCALMEGAFGYCVGCKFYGIYRKLFASK